MFHDLSALWARVCLCCSGLWQRQTNDEIQRGLGSRNNRMATEQLCSAQCHVPFYVYNVGTNLTVGSRNAISMLSKKKKKCTQAKTNIACVQFLYAGLCTFSFCFSFLYKLLYSLSIIKREQYKYSFGRKGSSPSANMCASCWALRQTYIYWADCPRWFTANAFKL